MDKTTATKAVTEVLTQIQTGQKLECPPLNGEIKPLRDLVRFDSPMSIAATGMIARKLKITIPPKTNVFGDKTGKFTIDKISGILCHLADEQKKNKAA